MLKTTIYFIAVLMCIAFSDAQKGCPGVGCPRILYPENCRAVTFFIHGKDKICQGCDQCKKKVNELDAKGCPPLECDKEGIRKKCLREMYYVYQKQTICKDCPQNTCRN